MPNVQVGIQTTYNNSGASAAAQGLNTVAQNASKADKALLQSAQTQARLASSQGDAARSAQILSNALSQVDRTTLQALRAETQLVNANNALAKSAQSASGGFAVLPRTIDGFSGSAQAAAQAVGVIASSAAIATTALAALKGAYDLAQLGAQAQLVETRFDGLAVAAGTTGDALIKALRAGSGGEISDLNLQLAANKAQLLGVAHSAEEFGVLMSIARDRAQQMGITTTQAFDDLVTGLGRGSRLILDNLGILVNADAANQAYAASIGKTVSALTDEERKQALINQVLKDGQATIAQTGGAVEGHAATYAQLSAATENAKSSLGSFLSNVLEPSAQKLTATADGVNNLFTWLNNLGAASTDVATRQAAATAATQAYQQALAQGLSTAEASAAAQQALAEALQGGTTAFGAYAQAAMAAAASVAAETAMSAQAAQAQLVYADSLEMAGIQARAAAAAAEIKANADQVAAVDAQTHKVAQEQLALQAQAAAQTLLNAGAAGATAAAQLAGSSQQIDVLTAAYYRLAAAQAAAAQAKTNAAALADQRAGERDGGSSRTAAQITFEADQDRKRRAAQVRRAEEAEREAKKGGGARVNAAAATAAKLEGIEQKTGDKIAEIVADTQQKITAIAEREAAKQQAALQKLNESIATSGADRRVSNEADDLDLIGVTDPKEAAKLNDREKAQAKAREAEKRAADEARATALAGDAELAQKQYEIREKQIGDQQALDEKYAEKQRELAEDPALLDAAKTQYDEATRANEERAQVGIDIAKAESEQKAQAVQAEKDAVIAAAEDQANKVIGAAERSASGVAKASQTAKDTATANLRAIGDAVNAIPSQKTITITVNQQGTVGAASTGGSSPNKSAGGGTFLSHGPTTLTVGDNPGGVELVSVTPVSGTGQTRVGGGLAKLAGGGVVVVDAGDGYTTPIAGGPAPTPGKGKGKGKNTPAPADPKAVREAIKESIELIKLQNELRKVQAEAQRLRPMPINYKWIEGLAIEAQEITRIVTSKLLPLKKDEAEALGKYASANGQAVDVLKNIADLRDMQAVAKKERPGEIVIPYIEGLASEAQRITQIVRNHLIPETELENDMYAAYADAVSSSVSVLNDAADLREKLAKPTPPIDIRIINQLVADAAVVTVIARDHLVPTTEEQADALGQYADAVGSSVGIIKDVGDLNRDMFADYYSPSDAEIGVLTNDAKRVTQGFIDAARTMDTAGLEAAKLYTETISQVLTNTKDQLEVMDRIRFSDLTVDPRNLAQLEQSGAMILGTIAAIGARASLIPAADLTAMNAATTAIKNYSEAMVTLNAVPFDGLAGINASLAGGGGGTVTNYITVQAAPGMDVVALANQVARVIDQKTGARR